MKGFYNSHGFSLLELLSAITVLSILVNMAAPAFETLLGKNAVRAAVSQVNSTLEFARSEAVLKRSAVSICSSSDLIACDDTNAWSPALLVFLDQDHNGTLTTQDCNPAEACLLRVVQFEDSHLSVTGGNSWLGFLTTGARNAEGAHQLSICTTRSGEASSSIYNVKISASGAKRTEELVDQCL